MRTRIVSHLWCLPLLAVLSGCMTPGDQARQLHSSRDRRMTVGIVQKEIRQGMDQAEVAIALGSPNIVTRDSQGNETWIYDKIATEASYSTDGGGIDANVSAGGMPGGRALVLGGVSTGYGRRGGAAATTQRTLTVIIKFDGDSRVSTFSYHSSRF